MQRNTLVALLTELAQWLELETVDSMDWVICGGVAMALQDLHPRTTRDVDVLGVWDSQLMQVVSLNEFPQAVKRCIQRVVANHPELAGLADDWVNLGPTRIARHGLPDGYAQRLKAMKFGNTPTLHLLHRLDLIPLKLYAAADRFSSRQSIHLDDLKRLNGSFDELDKAIDWMRTLPDFEEKRPEIQSVLERLGFDDLAGYV